MAKVRNPNKMEWLQNRQNLARKNFRYHRYLFLRYAIALFFFVNLYWAGGLSGQGVAWILPVGLVVLTFPATYEHWRLYGDYSEKVDNQLRFNRYYHRIQVIVNLILVFVALTGLFYQRLFPFLTTAKEVRMRLIICLILGICLSLFCLKRMLKIRSNTDRHYGYIEELERSSK